MAAHESPPKDQHHDPAESGDNTDHRAHGLKRTVNCLPSGPDAAPVTLSYGWSHVAEDQMHELLASHFPFGQHLGSGRRREAPRIAIYDDIGPRCIELRRRPASGVARRADGRPVSEHVVDRRLTTTAVLDQERVLLDWGRSVAEEPTPPRSLVNASALTDAQAQAARAVAGTAGLVVVVGPAGSGKTTMLKTAVSTLGAQGRAVEDAEFNGAPDARLRDVAVAPRRRWAERLAVVARRELLIGAGEHRSRQLAEPEAPFVEPPLAPVVHRRALRAEGRGQVLAKVRRRWGSSRQDEEWHEACERFDRRCACAGRPLRPLLGQPTARPIVSSDLVGRRLPRHRFTRVLVEGFTGLDRDQ